MRLYHLSTNYSYGIDIGYTGYYTYLFIWLRTRWKAKEYGPGEIRLYNPKWWKTYYNKKGQVEWEGTVIEHKGGY